MRQYIRPLFLIGTLVVAAPAYGQEDPRKAQAAPFFEEGRKLAEQGENVDSLEKFRKAHSIYPSPNTLFNIARQEHLTGRRLEAIRHYREALANPVLLPHIAVLGRKYVADLEDLLGKVRVLGPEGMTVTIQGVEHRLPLVSPIDVEPGVVHAVGVLRGEKVSRKVDAMARSVATVDLRADERTAAPAPVPVKAPLPPPPPPHDPTLPWVVPAAVGVAGLAAIGVGVGFGLSAKSSESDAKAIASATRDVCSTPSSLCDEYRDHRSDAKNSVIISAIGYGTGVVAGAMVAFLLWPRERKAHEARAIVTPVVGREMFGAGLSSSF